MAKLIEKVKFLYKNLVFKITLKSLSISFVDTKA